MVQLLNGRRNPPPRALDRGQPKPRFLEAAGLGSELARDFKSAGSW